MDQTSEPKARTVAKAVKTLLQYETNPEWTDFDEYMILLEWLNDNELHREVDFCWEKHTMGNPRCEVDHPEGECSVPVILDAISILMDVYNSSGLMSDTTRFVQRAYLTLDHLGKIKY